MGAARRIGRYRILFDLAEGGMGVVSAAELVGDRGFRRTVAVKRVHPHLARDPKFHEQFAREARLASRIADPGVVQVYELVEEQGELLLAMELVAGVSLRAILAATPSGMRLPSGVVAGLVANAARALHAAHVATDEEGRPLGLVHRDVTPENVLVSFRGEVKLTDFGVAKAVSRDSARSDAVRGKPPYFSPEQARGEALDPRSDIWSLGVVAWELLAGKQLFRGRNDLETIQRVLHDEVPPLDEAPPGIAAAIARCLEREREARWQTALELAEAMEAAVPDAATRGRDAIAAPLARWLPGEEKRFEARLRQARAAVVGDERVATGPDDAGPTRVDDPVRPRERFAIARPMLLSAVGFAVAFGASWWIDGAPMRFDAATVAAETAPPVERAVDGDDRAVERGSGVDVVAPVAPAIADDRGEVPAEAEETAGVAPERSHRDDDTAATDEGHEPRSARQPGTKRRRTAAPRMEREATSTSDPGFAEHFPL